MIAVLPATAMKRAVRVTRPSLDGEADVTLSKVAVSEAVVRATKGDRRTEVPIGVRGEIEPPEDRFGKIGCQYTMTGTAY